VINRSHHQNKSRKATDKQIIFSSFWKIQARQYTRAPFEPFLQAESAVSILSLQYLAD
jgi:hypothetical protein